ncbi:hypothetical protein L1987_23738 [Smallanthus sonchifolius]|uniref:Uncharacterized protein n=1 Tax=Smallanthus sonchifolius TaxID=185202 RepID=A0ACB9IHS8_9ASTR|nr:hypothetical protein L1987_23738 [Smallanthus sonchifolius]
MAREDDSLVADECETHRPNQNPDEPTTEFSFALIFSDLDMGLLDVYEHGGEISYLSWAVELKETHVFEHWLERQELQQR